MAATAQSNLFIELGLDPDQPWDAGKFAAALTAKQSLWTGQATNPSGKIAAAARRNLAAMNEWRKVAADPALRAPHAKEASALRAAQRAARLGAFTGRLTLLESRGFMLEAEVADLSNEFKDILSEAEIRKRVKMPIRTATPPRGPKIESADATKFRQIQDILNFQSQADLYVHMGLGSGKAVATSALLAEASDRLRRLQAKSSKKSEDDLLINLYRLACEVFAADDARAKYDHLLAEQRYEELAERVDKITKHHKEVTVGQMSQLLRDAQAQGLDPVEVTARIAERAKKQGAVVIVSQPAVDALTQSQSCGYCGRMNPARQKHCADCGKPLQANCPKCGEAVPSADRACHNCGFLTGNGPWINHKLAEADAALRERRPELAQRHVEAARKAWPAPAQDSRSQAITKMEKRVSELARSQATVLAQLDEAIKQHRFWHADEQLLPQLRRTIAADDDRIDRYTKQVTEQLDRAKRALPPREAADRATLKAYKLVLAHCADYDGGKLARDAEALEKTLGEMRKQENAEAAAIEQLVRDKRMYAAHKSLNQFTQEFERHRLASLKTSVERAIAEAESLVKQARAKKTSDREAAVAKCREALQICADCEDAESLLKSIAPSPPSGLRAEVRGNVVHLEWEASTSTGVTYRVVRKKATRPTYISDGEVLAFSDDDGKPQAMTHNQFCDDKEAGIGIPLYYAVYADRAGVHSVHAAVLDPPILRLEPVRELVYTVEDGTVRLQWKSSANANVIVRRASDSYPKRPNEGMKIDAVGEEAFDTQVELNRRYYYSVFAQFRHYDDSWVTSQPARIEVAVKEPPAPVSKLTMTAKEVSGHATVTVQWPAPSAGTVVILHTQKQGVFGGKDVVPEAELGRYGEIMPTRDNTLRYQLSEFGRHYFYAVVLWERQAYIGTRQQFDHVAEVTHSAVKEQNGALRLTWQWPDNAQMARVNYTHLDWPGLADETVHTVQVTRREVELLGYYELTQPKQIDYFVTVQVQLDVGGAQLVSKGESAGARCLFRRPSPLTLEYRIQRRWPHKLTLHLNVSVGTGKLPALVLVAKRDTPPIYRMDGQVVFRVGPRLIQDTIQWSFDLDRLPGRMYGKLFLEEDLYQYVNIKQPKDEELALF